MAALENFEVFSPCDFIAAMPPCRAVASEARRRKHIPDKGFQLVRYYGWYSNPDALARSGRGQRDKRVAEEAAAAGQAVQIIDVSEHKLAPHRDEVSGAGPRGIPSANWRDLIKKVLPMYPAVLPCPPGDLGLPQTA
jgi:hypothetical protein